VRESAKCPVIGLLGGIGAGKSTVRGIFESLGAVTIDADSIAKEVLRKPEIRSQVVEAFGKGILGADGEISRPALADAAFKDAALVGRLNSIVHPVVIAESRRIIDAARGGACPAAVLDAPLIVEAGLEDLCDCLVFVEASEDTRSRRIAASRGWDRREVARREKFQESLTLKRERADYIIDNDGSLEETHRQAVSIWGEIVKARPRGACSTRGQSGLS
jgi:dephospho-CoA kinase